MIKQEQLEVGSRIRKLRETRGHSLRVLAEHSGLSMNAISRIERGENSPTVSSLCMLAKALNVPIAAFFSSEEKDTTDFVNRKTRLLYEDNGVMMESLGAGLEDQQMEPFLMTLDNQTNSQINSITHSGEEFVYCLKGEIEYYVGKRRYEMRPGDSLLFKANQPHWCRQVTRSPVEVLVIFTATQESDIARERHMEMHSGASKGLQINKNIKARHNL
jgi:transcriptional regulator with XRE-family HTH domain